jgi:hypothetical protein
MSALRTVQKYFPGVTKVQDAKESIGVTVTMADNRSAKVKNHQACAMAVACKRGQHADGVIVSLNRAYIIKGNVATRYALPESAAREVVSFDREAGFAPGEYTMVPTSPSRRLGSISGGSGQKTGTGKPIVHKHLTSGIRTVLGSK